MADFGRFLSQIRGVTLQNHRHFSFSADIAVHFSARDLLISTPHESPLRKSIKVALY